MKLQPKPPTYNNNNKDNDDKKKKAAYRIQKNITYKT